MLFTVLFAVIIPFIHRISKKIAAKYAVNKVAIHRIAPRIAFFGSSSMTLYRLGLDRHGSIRFAFFRMSFGQQCLASDGTRYLRIEKLGVSWWRREWDSNPRGPKDPTGFRDQRLKPLGHPSPGTQNRLPKPKRQGNISRKVLLSTALCKIKRI